MKLYDLTKQLLQEYEILRSDDKKLLFAVWTKLGLTENGSITKENFYNAPASESVTRARRKVQQNNPELEANETVKAFRKEKESKKGYHVYHEEVKPFTPHMLFINGLAQRCNCNIGKDHTY